MKLDRVVLLLVLFLMFSTNLVFAQNTVVKTVEGKWHSAQVNSCGCDVHLTIAKQEDGSFTVTINFPGSQGETHDVSVDQDGTHISFSVNYRIGDQTAKFTYDAFLRDSNRDLLEGTFKNKDYPTDPGSAFSAEREKPPATE